MKIITSGRAKGVVIGNTVHVLKPSSSRYHLKTVEGHGGQYVCQDGCCDAGLQPDVEAVVREGSRCGATKVVLRMGQRGYYRITIAGLPVSDVSHFVGETEEGARIYAAW